MRILVTGATGNVGSQLLPQLLDSPSVTSVVGLARRLPADRDTRVEWTSVDLAEGDLRPLVRGADVVVHLAFLLQPAHDPDEMHRVNITGTRRLFDAVVAEGVPALVHASSVGAYSPGPKEPRATEDHPTRGVSSSTYSRHKAQVERMLDDLEREHPERRVVRIRPGIVFQAKAASALARYFLGPFVPQSLVRRALLPVVPRVDRLAIQGVHAEDVARAFLLAATTPGDGRVQRRRGAGAGRGHDERGPRRGHAAAPGRPGPRRRRRHLAAAPAADRPGLGRPRPAHPAHGHHARPRGPGLDAAALGDRRPGRDGRRDGPRAGRRTARSCAPARFRAARWRSSAR